MLSVSIVAFKPDVKLLNDVVQSLVESTHAAGFAREQWHLDIVNNALEDDVASRLALVPGWTDLLNKNNIYFKTAGGNVGYGAGNNVSILASRRTYHLVLNPDAILMRDTLAKGIGYLETHSDVGLAVPRVVGFDGEQHYLNKRNPAIFDMFLRSFAPGFVKRFFHSRMERFEMRDVGYDRLVSPIPFPTGCFMLLRTSVAQAIGGFDETYFLHFEDADLGRRVNQASKSVYLPEMQIQHKWARDSHKNWRIRWITIKSAFIYWRKWGGFWNPTE